MSIIDQMLSRNVTLSVTPQDLIEFVSVIKEQNMPLKVHEEDTTKEPLYLSTEETMKRLRVSRTTLWRWHEDGYLVHRKVGKYNRYYIEDIKRIEEGYNG